jgi:hypothetical protein
VSFVVAVAAIAASVALLLTNTLPEGPTLVVVTPQHGLVASDVALLVVIVAAVWVALRARRP